MKKIKLDFNKPSVQNATEVAEKTLAQGGYDIVEQRQNLADAIVALGEYGDMLTTMSVASQESTQRLGTAVAEFKRDIDKPRRKWGWFGR
ncbi:MAG: hypothetical protein ACAH80_07925 [Alphaproteobacteria bacterium]